MSRETEMNESCFKRRSFCYDMPRLPCSVISRTVHTDMILLATDTFQPFPEMMGDFAVIVLGNY